MYKPLPQNKPTLTTPTRAQKEAFLSQYQEYAQRINILRQRYDRQRSDAYNLKAVDYSKPPTSKTNKKSDISDSVARLLDLATETEAEIEAILKKMLHIKQTLSNRTTDMKLRTVLELRYIDNMIRKESADALNVSIHSIDKLYYKAINHFDPTQEDLRFTEHENSFN